jgi:hypothetical protein
MKIKTLNAVQQLLDYQQVLIKQAQDILKPAEQQLEQAKTAYHSALINHNQLMRKADALNTIISAEQRQELQEQKEAQNQWEVKGNHEMAENWLNNEQL